LGERFGDVYTEQVRASSYRNALAASIQKYFYVVNRRLEVPDIEQS
jgi:hypothetical protein